MTFDDVLKYLKPKNETFWVGCTCYIYICIKSLFSKKSKSPSSYLLKGIGELKSRYIPMEKWQQIKAIMQTVKLRAITIRSKNCTNMHQYLCSLIANLNYFWQVVTLLKAVGSGQWAVNHGQWTIYEVWSETNAQGEMSSLLIILKTPLFKDLGPSPCQFRQTFHSGLSTAE
jgi:hypothetical protein